MMRFGGLLLALGLCSHGWGSIPGSKPAAQQIVQQKSDGGYCAFPVYDEVSGTWRCDGALPGGGGSNSGSGCNGGKRVCAFIQNGEPYEVDYFFNAGQSYCLVYSTLDGCELASNYVDCDLVCSAHHF